MISPFLNVLVVIRLQKYQWDKHNVHDHFFMHVFLKKLWQNIYFVLLGMCTEFFIMGLEFDKPSISELKTVALSSRPGLQFLLSLHLIFACGQDVQFLKKFKSKERNRLEAGATVHGIRKVARSDHTLLSAFSQNWSLMHDCIPLVWDGVDVWFLITFFLQGHQYHFIALRTYNSMCEQSLESNCWEVKIIPEPGKKLFLTNVCVKMREELLVLGDSMWLHTLEVSAKIHTSS